MGSSRTWFGTTQAERVRAREGRRRHPGVGLLLFASLLAPGGTSAVGEDWQAFAPPGGGFRIEMPGEPLREIAERLTPIGIVRETKYWLAIDSVELAVETHDVPTLAAALMGQDALLDRARSGVIDNEEGIPLGSRELVFQGAPARRFTYRYPGRPPRQELAMTVLVGSRIYLLTGTGSDPVSHPIVRRFFASFGLLDPDETGTE
jgi:hypothetical protein